MPKSPRGTNKRITEPRPEGAGVAGHGPPAPSRRGSVTRVLYFLLLLTLPLLAATPEEQLARSVTIYRDTYGVPHIFAKTDAGAVFGLMYAQAEDNFAQVEADFIRITGRAAEVNGPASLANDVIVH